MDIDEDTMPDPGDELYPQWLTWKDPDGTIHVEVQEGWSEFCIWDMKNGKMVKTFDAQEVPF